MKMIQHPSLLRRLKRVLWIPWGAISTMTVRCSLRPAKDIRSIDDAFLSYNIDPQFHVTPHRVPLRRGWYLISYQACVNAPDALFTPKIYPTHNPQSEQNVIGLRPHVSGDVRQLVFLPIAINQFRLDPFDLDYPATDFPVLGRFSINNLTLVRIGAARVLFFCLFHGLKATRSRRLKRNVRTLYRLLLGRGYPSARRWLIHRTKSALAPPLTLSQWFRHYLEPTATDQSPSSEICTKEPRVLVLLPVATGDTVNARRTFESLLKQSYSQWQLLMFPTSDAPIELIQELRRSAVKEPKLRVVGKAPKSLAELPNVKNSDFICIVGAGDQLPVDALARIAHIICRDSPDIIYADEAQLQSNGVDLRRLNLRTVFNLDGFLSAPTLGFFTLTRIETLDINKPVPSVDAFALNEWLLLNALRQADKVIHLPEVLYLLASVQRPASRLAPQFFREFLQGRGFSDACVTPTATPGCRAVRYQTPSQGKTAIIIPTRDRVDLLQAAVDSLLATTSNDTVELIVVDHESNEPDTLEYLESLAKEHTVIHYTGSFNFSRINNLAVSYVSDRCDTVLFLNNDIEAITPGWLQSMLDKARRPDVGAVGATLLYPDNRIQHAGVITALAVADHFMADMPYASPYQQDLSTAVLPWIVTREFSAVTAACLAMRKSVFRDIGGFDEKLAVGFQDVDLCLRLKQQGYRVLFDGEAVLIHHTSATRSTSDNQALADSLNDPIFRLHRGDPHFEDTALFSTRYQALLNRADPFYHPLLSRLTHYYRLSRGARRPVVPDARSITLNLKR